MGSVADFYRALARGEAWTLKDDMQDAIIQQLLQRVEKLEQELAARSAPVSRAEIIDALIAALRRLKESEGR
jgi:outer membrane lipopolysaccharide assembly protein LptE/RlpB